MQKKITNFEPASLKKVKNPTFNLPSNFSFANKLPPKQIQSNQVPPLVENQRPFSLLSGNNPGTQSLFSNFVPSKVRKAQMMKENLDALIPLMIEESRVDPSSKLGQINKNKSSYDLEKGLSLEVKTLQNHFQFSQNDQTLPVMVSVKSLDSTDNQPENNIDSRPSIDLICVIDNSGSMHGTKIENVKTTLMQLVDMLQETDRLSLILFNNSPTLLSNLRTLTPDNKEIFYKIINSIHQRGGTNIEKGMDMAFSILGNRKETNPITSIFLLSDGRDDNADLAISNNLANGNGKVLEEKGQIYTIHSFGFGQDHDAPLMNRICEFKDGNFYYVEKIEQVDEFFVDALGGLFSVIAQEVEININLNTADPSFKKFFKGASITKTYGDMWKVIKQGEIYKIQISQLFSGISKDFVMEITVPGNAGVNKLEDFERNSEIVKATLTAIPVEIKNATKIAIDKGLILTLFTQSEKIAINSEINDDVEFNYFRVKAASAIEQAIKCSENKLYEDGQSILEDILTKISKSHPKNSSKLAVISQDILECKQNSRPQVYEQEGRFKLFSKKVANFKQNSQAVGEQDLFQNSIQKSMVLNQKIKKANY